MIKKLAFAAALILSTGPLHAGEIYAQYVNTLNVTVAPGEPAVTVTVPVGIPAGAVAVIGWRLSIFADNDSETQKWIATVSLSVNGREVDHLKDRHSTQGDAVMLPAGDGLELGPFGAALSIALRNREDAASGMHTVDGVRGNAWVYFLVVEEPASTQRRR